VQREAAALMMRSNGSMAMGSTAGNSNNTMTDALLRERGALQGSHSALDEVLGRAAETQAALSRQRSAMSSATGRLGIISAKLPTLQDLMQAIQRRRSFNDYVVAGVIAACLLFTLWYMFGGSGQKSDSSSNGNVKKTL
jgi:golgi SNAP receptor complex member 1